MPSKSRPRPKYPPRICACPAPDGRIWCWRCLGSVAMTPEQHVRVLRSIPGPPPAGGGEARPVAVA